MDVKISMNTTQYNRYGETDTISMKVNGKMYNKNDGIYLTYKEEGEQSGTTTIRIKEKEVLIKKFGDTTSDLLLKYKMKSESKYRTPYGIFEISTFTNKLDIRKENEENLKLVIDYDMKITNLFEGRNKIILNVEKINQ